MNILSHRPPSGMRIVNAASGTGTSLDDLIHAIEFATGQALTRNYMNSRKVDASRVVMDISKSMYDFRWTPTTDLRKGLGRTWEWFKSIQN
jgi:UDP-glucose 4-epimerase